MLGFRSPYPKRDKLFALTSAWQTLLSRRGLLRLFGMNVFNSPIPVLFRDTNIPCFTVWGSLPFSKLGRHFASPFIRSTTSLLCFTMADSSAVSATPMKGSSILSELAGTAGKLMPSFLQDDELRDRANL